MTATTPDVDAITGLDFDPELPCEMTKLHAAIRSNEPAVYLLAACCPACHWTSRLVACRRCWDYSAPPRTVDDSACGAGGFTRDECWKILRVIGGA